VGGVCRHAMCDLWDAHARPQVLHSGRLLSPVPVLLRPVHSRQAVPRSKDLPVPASPSGPSRQFIHSERADQAPETEREAAEAGAAGRLVTIVLVAAVLFLDHHPVLLFVLIKQLVTVWQRCICDLVKQRFDLAQFSLQRANLVGQIRSSAVHALRQLGLLPTHRLEFSL
jgi:hypothetical protein